MTPQAIDFIRKNVISVFTTMISDGGPHSAAMYYVFDTHEKTFYMVADINGMKCENLSETDETFGSMVIGTDPENWSTMQLRGSVTLVPQESEEFVIKNSFKEMPQLSNYLDHPNRVIIKFVPAWWRFTDSSSGTISMSE